MAPPDGACSSLLRCTLDLSPTCPGSPPPATVLRWEGLSAQHCACMLSHFSHVQHFVTTPPHPALPQAPLSMGFSRQECWRRLPCPPPGDLSDCTPHTKPPSTQSHWQHSFSASSGFHTLLPRNLAESP